MAKKYKGSSVKRDNLIEMVGVSDLLNKIEAAGGKVDEAVKKATDNCLELVGMNMQLFMMSHKQTGETYGSYEQIKAVVKNGKAEAIVGYDVNKGGLPSIFLDVGTPKQKPYFYRYYAVENSQAEITRIQQETLKEILKELI